MIDDKDIIYLTEAGPRRDHDKYPLVGNFKAASAGSWDNMSWGKGDVGSYSRPFHDRNGFKSIFVRFTGEKTARMVPEVIFRKFFHRTGETELDGTQNKGGIAVGKGRHQLSKDEIKKDTAKLTGGIGKLEADKSKDKTLKKEEVDSNMENSNNKETLIPDVLMDIFETLGGGVPEWAKNFKTSKKYVPPTKQKPKLKQKLDAKTGGVEAPSNKDLKD